MSDNICYKSDKKKHSRIYAVRKGSKQGEKNFTKHRGKQKKTPSQMGS